ncbi:hypothetical protein O6A27_29675, partial [Escherichia coli]|nr:hypothetical protein [Escherichia coli]
FCVNLRQLATYYSHWRHSLASFACVSFGFPVILVGGAILLTGIVCTVVLNEIDAQCHLSEKLKYAIILDCGCWSVG